MFYSKRQVSDLPYITLPGGICASFSVPGIRRNHGEPWFCPATSEGGHARRKTCPPLSARFYRMGAESRPGFQKYPFPCFPRPFRRSGRFPCGRRPGVLSCPPGSGEGRGTCCGSPFRQASSGNHAEIPAVSLPCRLSSLLCSGQSEPGASPCSFRHRGQR